LTHASLSQLFLSFPFSFPLSPTPTNNDYFGQNEPTNLPSTKTQTSTITIRSIIVPTRKEIGTAYKPTSQQQKQTESKQQWDLLYGVS
jgi:hypothetical protein